MCHTEEIYVNSFHQAYTIQGILTMLKSMANVLTNLRAQHANLHKEHLMLSAILFFKNKVLFVTGSWQRTEYRSDSLFSSSGFKKYSLIINSLKAKYCSEDGVVSSHDLEIKVIACC